LAGERVGPRRKIFLLPICPPQIP